jgi:hypothetical protein
MKTLLVVLLLGCMSVPALGKWRHFGGRRSCGSCKTSHHAKYYAPKNYVRVPATKCTDGVCKPVKVNCSDGVCKPVATTNAAYSLQHVAQNEANEMARRGYAGHIDGCPPGARFEGCGASSSPNVPTCTPSRPMQLIADAKSYSHGTRMWYRVRLWR